jgi:hypothetical protein
MSTENLIWFKLYLIVIVLVTVYFSNPPYFPIEISRCAASTPFANDIFSMGLIQSFLIYAITAQKPGVPIHISFFCIWLSLSIIGLFNDVDYWIMHMFGVTALVLSILWKIHQEQRTYSLLLSAVALYMTRFIIKAHALLFLEQVPFKNLAKANFDIMFGNTVVTVMNPRTLVAFQFAGVFQWIFLGVLCWCM